MKKGGKLYPIIIPIFDHEYTHLGSNAILGDGNEQSHFGYEKSYDSHISPLSLPHVLGFLLSSSLGVSKNYHCWPLTSLTFHNVRTYFVDHFGYIIILLKET
jgi:hypothetical protein